MKPIKEMVVVERADPKNLTEADYKRAVKDVKKTNELIERGKTPAQLIFDILELMSVAKHSKDNNEDL